MFSSLQFPALWYIIETFRCKLSTVIADDAVTACSGLSHPHLLAAKSVFRQGNWLCIVQDFANGGDLFSLARRCGNDGLPESTARFLIQQVALTFAFAHHYGISMQDISPSKLLIAWSPKKMPILKVNLMKTLQKLLPPYDQVPPQALDTATLLHLMPPIVRPHEELPPARLLHHLNPLTSTCGAGHGMLSRTAIELLRPHPQRQPCTYHHQYHRGIAEVPPISL